MNLNKHLDFFNPHFNEEVHIIGVGAIGSNIASQLVRLGVTDIHIWDFDTVDEHNITNQIYTSEDIGKLKVDALKEYLLKINPKARIITHKKYTRQPLQGILFSCVDSIKVRREIALQNEYNLFLKLVIDTRIGLETGQVFVTHWQVEDEVKNYLAMCDFNDDETDAVVNACGTTLSISPTVLITTAYAVASLINFINGKTVKNQILFNAFDFKTRAV